MTYLVNAEPKQLSAADVPAAVELEINLIDYITTRLGECGHPNPSGWQNGLHPDAFMPPDFSTQRFLVNRQLRQLIGMVPDNTTQIRFCLVESGSCEDWLRLFEQMVLPCMMKHSIPQSEYLSAKPN